MSKPKRQVPIDRFLIHCRNALAGAGLAGIRWVRVTPHDHFEGISVKLLEQQSFLSFLGRAHRLLEDEVPDTASLELKAAAQAFIKQLPDARTLRNMLEHADAYERKGGSEQEKWAIERPAPKIEIGGLKIEMAGVARSEGPNTFMSVSHPQGQYGLIAGRLDPIKALKAIEDVIAIVHEELSALLATRRPRHADPKRELRQELRALAKEAASRSTAERTAGARSCRNLATACAQRAVAESRAMANVPGTVRSELLVVLVELRDPLAACWARMLGYSQELIASALAEGTTTKAILALLRSTAISAFKLDCPELARAVAGDTSDATLLVVMTDGTASAFAVPNDSATESPTILVEDATTLDQTIASKDQP